MRSPFNFIDQITKAGVLHQGSPDDRRLWSMLIKDLLFWTKSTLFMDALQTNSPTNTDKRNKQLTSTSTQMWDAVNHT